jgi:hypothetical protein
MNDVRRQLWRGIATTAAFVLSVAGAHAQTTFLGGQSIQPVYEGWEKAPDGTITMVFGYLNRNYQEEPEVTVGTNNKFEPGPVDRGQPTHFDPRRQSFVFRVPVPADWGAKELVWTLTHNGVTATAIGVLTSNWVLDEGVFRANRGSGISGRLAADYLGNKPPTVQITGPASMTAKVGEAITLAASANDDGRPGPRPKPPGRPSGEGGVRPKVVLSNPDLPTFGGDHSGAASGTGGPTDQNIVQVSTAYETGLGITWRHHRGPGKATFSSRASALRPGAPATTTVRFTTPGTHVIRAVADDSTYTTGADVTIVVGPAN